MKKSICIINGPNLNLLGIRQPEIYGTQTFESYFLDLKETYASVAKLHYFQSNHEGALIDKIQAIGFEYDGILLNAGGYTHTSIALADCISAITTPVVEVHISNIKTRESFRQHSYLETVCIHSIMGQGLLGYNLSIDYILSLDLDQT